jgi:hypothetical protein
LVVCGHHLIALFGVIVAMCSIANHGRLEEQLAQRKYANDVSALMSLIIAQALILHRRNNAALRIGGDVQVGRAAIFPQSHWVHLALWTVPPERSLSIRTGLDAEAPAPKR